MSKHKDSKKKSDRSSKNAVKKKRSKVNDSPGVASKERARAHFLDGETGPWSKKLAKGSAASEEPTTNSESSEGTAQSTPARLADRRGPDYSAPSSIDIVADPVLHAISTRRSISKLDRETPNDSDLRELIRAVSSVADHKGLKPWRFLILRGDDRIRLGEALDEADGVRRTAGEVNVKPLRAELLLALVASPQNNPKVPEWEQHATAAGAGHLLELALWQAGWGVMWRSGNLCNAPAVRRLHRLEESELLMGWLYIGAVPESYRLRLARSTRPLPNPDQFLDTL